MYIYTYVYIGLYRRGAGGGTEERGATDGAGRVGGRGRGRETGAGPGAARGRVIARVIARVIGRVIGRGRVTGRVTGTLWGATGGAVFETAPHVSLTVFRRCAHSCPAGCAVNLVRSGQTASERKTTCQVLPM